MSAPDLVIDVEGVTKCFDGHPVVNGISMQVRRGEIHGFLGPNGSGKTTFIRMLCGLLRPDGGRGTCLGHDLLTGSDNIKREVAVLRRLRGTLNVVALEGAYEDDDAVHIVMEVCEASISDSCATR